MAATDPRLSFLGAESRPGFVVRLVRIGPDDIRPCRSGEWAEALVVVEAGTIELQVASGRRARFGDGALLYLTGLGLTGVRNVGPRSAVLSVVARDRRGTTREPRAAPAAHGPPASPRRRA